MEFLIGQDPGVGATVQVGYDHQRRNTKLIASENFVDPAVLSAAAAVFTNKCAEGYPGRRYYDGCQRVDMVEDIARKQVCQSFGADCANVQPHCGASANYVMYAILCEYGDIVLSIDLASGDHLTHGSPVSFSGKNYNIVAYGISDQGYVDYDQVCDLAEKHRSRMLLAGAPAYPHTIDLKTFADIAHEVEVYLLVGMAHITGPVVMGLHPFPVSYADVVTATTRRTLHSPRGGTILCKEALVKKIDPAISLGSQGGPLGHIIAAKAVALGEAMKPEFKAYQKQILKNVAALVKALMTGSFDLVNDGTGNHLMLMDLRPACLTDKEIKRWLDEVNITIDRNAIPNGPEKPFVTSSIWAGMPAATTHGSKGADMEAITSIMRRTAADSEGEQDELRAQVAQLTGKYPLYE